MTKDQECGHIGQNQGHQGLDSAKPRILEVETTSHRDGFDKSSKPTPLPILTLEQNTTPKYVIQTKTLQNLVI